MKRSVTVPSLALLLVVACSSPPDGNPNLGGPPPNARGYPSETPEGIVFAAAHYRPDHASIFRFDLLRELGIVPVHLEVKLRGEGQETAQYLLSQELWEPRLILQDGTVIHATDVEDFVGELDEDDANRVRAEGFQPGLLDAPRSGFVFFRLEPRAEFRVERDVVRHVTGGTTRGIDVTESLLVFKISKGDVPDDFYVGIRP